MAQAQASAERLTQLLLEHVDEMRSAGKPESKSSLKNWINTKLVIPKLGITDAREHELQQLASSPETALVTFSDMISLRAHVGWSTHGHSAVDVNIYSSGGPGTEAIRGNVENTDVGKFLREYLNVDVDDITKELNDKMDIQKLKSLAAVEGPDGHMDVELKTFAASAGTS